jgi:hypothetical protein
VSRVVTVRGRRWPSVCASELIEGCAPPLVARRRGCILGVRSARKYTGASSSAVAALCAIMERDIIGHHRRVTAVKSPAVAKRLCFHEAIRIERIGEVTKRTITVRRLKGSDNSRHYLDLEAGEFVPFSMSSHRRSHASLTRSPCR